jgi:hypothetical protein
MPGNTTNFGFEYPLSTDNLSDGAQSIQDFATLADSTFVDLKGGTTNELLAKNSATDMDYKWVAGINGGTTGQVLTKDTSTDYDYSWTTLTIPAGVTVPYLQQTSGDTYQGLASAGTQSSAFSALQDRTYFTPFYVQKDATVFNQISVRAGTVTTSVTCRLGIYASDGTGGKPSTLILDAGNATMTSTGAVGTLTISQSLDNGIYWLAANAQTIVPNNASANLYGNTGGNELHLFGGTAALNATPWTGYIEDATVTGAFANAGAVSRSNAVLMSMRVA